MSRFRIAILNALVVKHHGEPHGGIPTPGWVAILYAGLATVLGLAASTLELRLNSGSIGALVLFTLMALVLMSLAVPGQAVHRHASGYISFAALAQVAALLILGPLWGALATATAVALWSLATPQGYGWTKWLFRTGANTGMFFIAALAAGNAYLVLGGSVPLVSLSLTDLARVVVLALTLQILNEILFLGLAWRRTASRSRHHPPIDWVTFLTEAGIGFTGLVAALAYADIPPLGFAVFIAFVLSAALVFNRLGITMKRERQQVRELTAIDRVNQAVNANLDLDSLLEVIFTEARKLVTFSAFHIALYLPEQRQIEIRLNYDEGVFKPLRRRPLGQGLLTWPVEHDEAIFIPDTRGSDHPALGRILITGRAPLALIALPIRFREQIVGVLSVQDYAAHAFNLTHKRLLENFANQVGSAIANTRLRDALEQHRRTLEERVASRTAALEHTTQSLEQALREQSRLFKLVDQQSRHDPLTELPNRREIDSVLQQEIYRAARFGHPLAVSMADLDYFKQINDTWGHAAGDRVLCAIAELFRAHLRTTDSAGRYGGEEFVIVFPETNMEEALTACENMRLRVSRHDWSQIAPGLEVKISLGIAALGRGCEQAETLLAAADQALYRAKSAGRNRVAMAPAASKIKGKVQIPSARKD